MALGQFVDLIGRDEGLEDVRVYRALGQLEHREGRTLAALQSAYQVGTRTMWRRLGEGPTARTLPAEVIFSLAEALFSYVEQISAASVAGWADEEANRAGSLQARRHALVELLARRPPAGRGRGRAGGRGRRAGRCRPGWPRWSWPTRSRWPPGCPGRSGPISTRSGWCWSRRRTGPAGSTGCGPAWPAGARWSARRWRPAQAYRSIARAQAAWPLHVAGLLQPGSPDPLARADEHLLALLLAAEPELAADLLRAGAGAAAGAAGRGGGPRRADAAGLAGRARRRDRGGRRAARAPADRALPAGRAARDRSAGALDDPDARLELALALRARLRRRPSRSGPSHPGRPPGRSVSPVEPPAGTPDSAGVSRRAARGGRSCAAPCRTAVGSGPGGVGQAVALADLPDPRGDLGVPVARQVREQVVLDLVATGCRS